jgi:hypothetical protein
VFLGRAGRSRRPTFRHSEGQSEIEDNVGRAVVRVPGHPPAPEPGDELPWEIVCSIAGQKTSKKVSRGESPALDRFFDDRSVLSLRHAAKFVERIVMPGDMVHVGGFASAEVVPDDERDGYRAVPMRLVLTANADYRLVIVKP